MMVCYSYVITRLILLKLLIYFVNISDIIQSANKYLQARQSQGRSLQRLPLRYSTRMILRGSAGLDHAKGIS